MMEWADGSQPVRQTVGGGKWVALSLLNYRDGRNFWCGGLAMRRFILPSYTRIAAVCASIMPLLKKAVNFCGATWSLY